MNRLIFIAIILLLNSCKTYKPDYVYQQYHNTRVDYTNLNYWAAHPNKTDEADLTPEGDTVSTQGVDADVFFIHPTTYTGEKGQDKWNSNLDDAELNRKTDEGTIRFQASAFNHAGRVFAPRYRQAHLYAYFTADTISAKKAFDFAYKDVKEAFEYYLKYFNNDRPIIIASHSQGTNHAERLLTEYFDQKTLYKKLVISYLIGMPVAKDRFTDIKPCIDSTDTGCFVSWRTFKKAYHLPKKLSSDKICVTNPLSWKTDETYMPKSANKGTLLFKFNKIYQNHVDAQVCKDILWSCKPKFPGSLFLWTKNYHPADINLYYFNIRENALSRVKKFLEKSTISNLP
ncbi:MAG: DUF3089 domain-containing protein [Saprospiraceae bacterium]|nr:DUF3089 domain-containing protein [Saprospiraceae bacterium]